MFTPTGTFVPAPPSTDGLTNFVARHGIADLLRHADPEWVVAGLVAAALVAGARDNVTCVVVDAE
jgi:protein phosphatase